MTTTTDETTILTPELAASLRHAIANSGERLRRQLRILGASIDAQREANERRRCDRDDELDWLGEWRGRRG